MVSRVNGGSPWQESPGQPGEGAGPLKGDGEAKCRAGCSQTGFRIVLWLPVEGSRDKIRGRSGSRRKELGPYLVVRKVGSGARLPGCKFQLFC